MTTVVVTGSTDGLGLGAAAELLAAGHRVVVHARSAARRPALADLEQQGAEVVVGDLRDPDATRDVADQLNRLGPVDAVIHNAGTMATPDVLPVNVVAPYLLTALVPADRLVYLSSGMHAGGAAELDRLDWSGRRRTASYSDSKLLVTALACAVARLRPAVLSNAVNPGWVPTRMGGPGAPDDLRQGHLTQVWLATSDAPEALTSGGYWFHHRREQPHPAALDPAFQDRLLAGLAAVTGVPLPA